MTDTTPSLPSTLTGDRRAALSRWMSIAVAEEKMCESEPGRTGPAPKVGVVVLDRDDVLLGQSHRGAHDPGDHAEYGLLQKQLADVDLAGATVFTTLEPCTKRGEGKIPCAQRLIERKVGTVYIGMYDPFPPIYRQGWRQLTRAGIAVYDFFPEHRLDVQFDNREFTDALALSIGERGKVSFDYTQNNGSHPVIVNGTTFVTRWSRRGAGSIYGYSDTSDGVALARGARTFDEVDDPRALHWGNRHETVHVGQIVVFRAGADFLMVQIEEVTVASDAGDGHFSLTMNYQARSPNRLP